MADEMPQESAETLETSPVEEKTPEEAVGETQQTPTEEEAAWNSLKGNTQDRIRQILRERDEYKNRVLEPTHQDHSTSPQLPADDEVKQAVVKLKEHGVVTREELNGVLERLETDKLHSRLESEFDGSDGRPKYVREEVEDYARKNNIWNLKAAYRDMYFDEFVDRGRREKSVPYTEKPSSSNREEPLSIESLRQKLRGPGAVEYYEKIAKDPQKLDKILRQLAE